MDDEMDYVMHHRREATLSLSPPTQPSLTQQQAPPRRQCPYWSDHQLSAFPPHPHFNPGIHPSSHNQQPNRSHHSPQPSLDASFSRSQAPHPYDPVHSSIPHLNNNWYPGTQSYHWSPITLPHPRASLDAFYPYPSTSSNNGAGSAATPGNNSSGERPTPTSGPVQPPVVQNQQTPRHEPFTPFPIAWQQQSGGPVRFSHFASQMSAPNQNQHNAQQSNDPAPASSPPSRTEGSHGNGNHESSGIRLPALQSLPTVLPRPGQASQNQAQQASTGTDDAQLTRPSARLEPSASAIGPSSNDGSPAPLGRLYENFFRNQLRDQSLFGGPSHRTETPEAAGNVPQSDGANRGMAPSPPLDSSNVPPRRLINMRHRQTPRRGESSDYDSDEDSADERLSWQEAAATNAMLQRLDDPLSARGVSGFSQEEDHRVREYQLARGAMKKKNVASSHAIASLQSVTISDLPDDEKKCIICYNDYGEMSPEGINEAPLRLPKCKHVFGDHCIKKWFAEADTCPYCRGKVPSESRVQVTSQGALRDLMRNRAPLMPSHQLSLAHIQALRMAQGFGGSDTGAMDLESRSTTDAARQARFANALADTSPQRAWQSGGRRSPPSEAENRRRTRARHGSFRTPGASVAAGSGGPPSASRALSVAGAMPSAHQHRQSMDRDRLNNPPWWNPNEARPSLTPLSMGQQYNMNDYRPHNQLHGQLPQSADNVAPWHPNYGRAGMMPEPLGLNPPSAPGMQGYQNYMPPPVFSTPPFSNQAPQDQAMSNTRGPQTISAPPAMGFPGLPSLSSGMSPHAGQQPGYQQYTTAEHPNHGALNTRGNDFSLLNNNRNSQGNLVPVSSPRAEW